jgi:hypothetical protein
MTFPIRDARRSRRAMPALCAFAALAAGCGGGGGDSASTPPPSGAAAAAIATANSSSNACNGARPFYWEVGDAGGTLVAGSVVSSSDPTVYGAGTVMSIASASKWFYSTYFVQRTGGALSASDIKFLNFQSGYSTGLFSCTPSLTQTVQECVDLGDNGAYHAADDGVFSYSGAHMQKHASLNGLGDLNSLGLAAEVRSQVGNEISFSYFEPQPAGGMAMSANDYAMLLRKIVRGELRMHDALGTHPVCTNFDPLTCPNARISPTPPGESWHYSVGHWVEDDPSVGDGAFSSPGAFGFYPWIDRTRTYYGVIARNDMAGALKSVYCGRLIRKAWVTATPQ